jgi:UDP-N-acetylmuramoyl-tripeptide--D-alanyl-D-alanine ligase
MTARFDDSEVLQATGARKTRAGTALSFEAVCTDSRALTPGCLFVALQGERFDAQEFLAQAVRGGAAGLVVNEGRAGQLEGLDVSVYEV